MNEAFFQPTGNIWWGLVISSLLLVVGHYIFRPPLPKLVGHLVTIYGVVAVGLGIVVYNGIAPTPFWVWGLFFGVGALITFLMHGIDMAFGWRAELQAARETSAIWGRERQRREDDEKGQGELDQQFR